MRPAQLSHQDTAAVTQSAISSPIEVARRVALRRVEQADDVELDAAAAGHRVEISGTQRAGSGPAIAGVGVGIVEAGAGCRLRTSTGARLRWTAGSTWEDVAYVPT